MVIKYGLNLQEGECRATLLEYLWTCISLSKIIISRRHLTVTIYNKKARGLKLSPLKMSVLAAVQVQTETC